MMVWRQSGADVTGGLPSKVPGVTIEPPWFIDSKNTGGGGCCATVGELRKILPAVANLWGGDG